MPFDGGKSQSGVAQRIVNLMPPHRVFIECFLGSGAVMRLKKPAAVNIGIDVAWAPNLALPAGVELIRGDAIDFLAAYAWRGDELVYLDPPYVMSTRGNRRYYPRELSDADHRRLLTILLRLPARAILSGYPSELYASLGFGVKRCALGWTCETFQVMTRGHTWATECLWFNFPRPTALHDLRFVGGDKRERWRIEKRRRRWRAKFQAMPPLERAALFDVLSELMREGPGAESGAARGAAAGAGDGAELAAVAGMAATNGAAGSGAV